VTARVKICGLSTPETMEAALEAGADYVGLVFFPRSPRHVEMAAARELAMMASGTADVVALLVDPDDDERGHFGIYGGRFVAETLMPLILELEAGL
jgi:phosphoribosylanthranilate isomerase